MGLGEGGLEFVVQVSQAVQAAGLDLDAKVHLAQHQVWIGGTVAPAEVEGNPGTREFGAGDEFGPHNQQVIVEGAGVAEVAAYAARTLGLRPLQGLDDALEGRDGGGGEAI
ncbi:hypothetical protein [Streptomyces gardneri]|uniref:hypothetical protein n=1 Tax=Streptomyces gardneri TaxID=66892 RepID=UPI0033DEAB64